MMSRGRHRRHAGPGFLDHVMGSRGRRRDRRLRGCRRRRGGRSGPRRRRRPGPGTHRILGRCGGDGRRIHLPRRRHTTAKGLRLRRFRRQHGGVPQRRDGARRRREPDRRLLRRQRRPLRLARRLRRAVQGGVLLRARLGTDGRPGPDVQRRRKRLPVQHHRLPRPARACPADVEQEAGRSQRRLHADEAARRDRDCGRRAGALRRAGAAPDRRIRRPGGRDPRSPVRQPR